LRVTSFSDSAAALESLDRRHFALILSDNRMPGVTGLELLQAAKARSPNTRRILITGYTDLDEAVQAFNEKWIHRFIRKPWEAAELLGVIREELSIYAEQEREGTDRQELSRQARKRSEQVRAALRAMQRIEQEFSEESRQSVTRHLAAVVVADVVGYSLLMGRDPEATVRTLDTCRGIWHGLISRHRGRLINEPGDSLLATFESAAAAIQCATDVQQELRDFNRDLPEAEQMCYRIGVTVGEVIEQAGALYGEGINIAARLQALAAPGEVWVSQTAFNQVKGLRRKAEFMGEQRLHNISDPVGAYRIRV
jgi:class 3 adenylate cyclase